MARHARRRQGFAQGVFQVGGHAGYARGPLLAAAIVAPKGQWSLALFSGVAFAAMAVMAWTPEIRGAAARAGGAGPMRVPCGTLARWP